MTQPFKNQDGDLLYNKLNMFGEVLRKDGNG